MLVQGRLRILSGLSLSLAMSVLVAGQGTPTASSEAAASERQNAAGREIYTSLCQSCHQPEGEGAEGLVPSLVGSALVLAPAEVGVRIVLHGKASASGAMSALGRVLNDEQIADALTFIRREWGNEGTRVAPALVAAVRAETASRNRPWTEAELASLVPNR